MKRSSVFLSYSSDDKTFAQQLARDLESKDIEVWLDEREILVGDSLLDKIRDGIHNMEYLVVILSPESVNSQWVQLELTIAMNKEIAEKRIKVLPLMYKTCKLPEFLEKKNV